MNHCRVHIGPGDQIELAVGNQHISRITHREARDLVAQLLVFANRSLREEVTKWLTQGKIEMVAEVLRDPYAAESVKKYVVDGDWSDATSERISDVQKERA